MACELEPVDESGNYSEIEVGKVLVILTPQELELLDRIRKNSNSTGAYEDSTGGAAYKDSTDSSAY